MERSLLNGFSRLDWANISSDNMELDQSSSLVKLKLITFPIFKKVARRLTIPVLLLTFKIFFS